jgi:hypothetical protein
MPLAQSPLPQLSFPYNWSNSQMDARVMIAHILDRAIFVDVLESVKAWGLAVVKEVRTTLADEPMRDVALDRMLRNIERAQSQQRA